MLTLTSGAFKAWLQLISMNSAPDYLPKYTEINYFGDTNTYNFREPLD